MLHCLSLWIFYFLIFFIFWSTCWSRCFCGTRVAVKGGPLTNVSDNIFPVSSFSNSNSLNRRFIPLSFSFFLGSFILFHSILYFCVFFFYSNFYTHFLLVNCFSVWKIIKIMKFYGFSYFLDCVKLYCINMVLVARLTEPH